MNSAVQSPPAADSSIPARFGSGREVRRVEDEKLLSGRGRYADDVRLEGQQYLAFLRSPYAHARIVSIDAAAARAMEGVAAIYTGADLVEAGVQPMAGADNFKRADGSAAASAPRRALAHERVRFVGEAVACVVADSVQSAKDAAEAMQGEYEELPFAVTLEQAMAPGASAVCDAAQDNIAAEMRHGDAKAAATAFERAAHVVSLDLVNQRVVALTMEPRTVLASIEAGADGKPSRLSVRISTQMPTGVRTSLCSTLGLKTDQVRVTVGDVGGGFGMKTGAYPEDVAVAFAAWSLKRPVKWAADRSEEFVSATHGRDVHSHLELALDANGRILALRCLGHANVGAYATGTGVAIQLLIGPWVLTSLYDIPLIDFHFKAVLSNIAPTGAYRGAGRPEAIYNIERLMDEAAREVGIDRLELRRRNFIRPEQMPYTNPMAQVYDSGRFEHVMDQALQTADWQGFDARAAESNSSGKLRGLGIATFLEWTGGMAFEETVTVQITPDGMIEVFSAVMEMGQGIATSLAQLVVDTFGVPISQVRVVLGDTDRGNGFGSAGSRSIFVGGSAVRVAADRTIDKARELTAAEFEVAAQDVRYESGQLTVAGTDLKTDLFELAKRQQGERIYVESTSSVAGPTWPNGCHICEVEIERETGAVSVVRYASVNDVGHVVNPLIVRGQLDGGAVQGIGQALVERVVYDPDSGQPLTGSLMDYAAPRADLIACDFDTHMDQSTPCLNNPMGIKGVGELGTIGASPCVVNAVADAFARAGMTDRTNRVQMPLSPARVWGWLNGRG